MWSRALLLVLIAFWGVMSVLLWRAEYGVGRLSGTPIRPDVVWQKILTSPDSSSLAVYRAGQRIGFCHILASVGDTADRGPEDGPDPEGRVRQVGGYNIQVAGNVALDEDRQRLRIDGELSLALDQSWQSLDVRLVARPVVCEIRSEAKAGIVRVRLRDSSGSSEHTLRLADLQNPEVVFREYLGAAAPMVLHALPLSEPSRPLSDLSTAWAWEARTDTLRIGSTATRVYRLQASLLETYQVTLIVSRAGEILRLELPGQVVLLNDILPNL